METIPLSRSADRCLLWGIASIVLGWTLFVPAIGMGSYSDTVKLADKESAPTPRRALVGFSLAVVFGVIEGGVMIAYVLTKNT